MPINPVSQRVVSAVKLLRTFIALPRESIALFLPDVIAIRNGGRVYAFVRIGEVRGTTHC